MADMTADLPKLGQRFLFHRRFLDTLVEGFTPEDWAARPGPEGGNTAHWILGHLVLSRRYLARKLGGDVPKDDWEDTFHMGSRPDATESYPEPPALLADFAARGREIAAALEELSPKQAAAEWGSSFPDGGQTVGEGAWFLHFHEVYHLGQLGLLRRLLGKPRFA